MVKDTDYAYIAGIIDGEGSITFSRNRSGKHNPTPMIYLCNSSTSMMMKIVMLFRDAGIEYNYYTRNSNHIRYKEVHTFRVSKATSLIILIKGIAPYLVAKRQQAELMLQSIEESSDSTRLRRWEIRTPYALKIWDINSADNSRCKKEVCGGSLNS